MSECLFCRITAGSLPTEFVYEDEHVVAFRDINPAAPVHILVVPRAHIETVAALGGDTTGVMSRLTAAANRIARESGVHTDGYRLIVNCGRDGGQTIFHLHMHLLGGRKMPELAA
ncbi:MAG: histidine triad nucleotide-binding protein [Gemmatimonadetes bacterium]|nr:histidine triad nucleotide-binding protein [Gemmatimonadota bacterium]